MTHFIEVADGMLSADFCKHCIQKFNQSKRKSPGLTGHGVDVIKKNSTDITISSDQDWSQELGVIQNAVLSGLLTYVRKYPFLLAGAVALQIQTDNGVEQISYVDIPGLSDDSLVALIKAVYRLGSVNIQKYNQNEGGYFYYHSEVYPHPKDPANDALHRTLLWMFYLNDVEEGGETEFYFQNIKTKPKQGTLVIAPAGFTHTHRGNMPISSDKYIFTSWLMFNKSEQLYGTSNK